MGEQFISDRARHSRTERCAAHEREVRRRSLFSDKPQVLTTKYRCEPTVDRLVLHDSEPLYVTDDGGDQLGVVQGVRRIGVIKGVDAAHCLVALRGYCPTGAVLPARVVDAPGFDGIFAIMILPPGGAA